MELRVPFRKYIVNLQSHPSNPFIHPQRSGKRMRQCFCIAAGDFFTGSRAAMMYRSAFTARWGCVVPFIGFIVKKEHCDQVFCKAAADRYSARPGYSEHQTGLAFDLIDKNGNLVQESGASQWLLDNAYKYGFIVRYLEGKEGSTGYMPESWHLRYIGQEAKEIAQSGKSLEEYFGITGGGYEDQ